MDFTALVDVGIGLAVVYVGTSLFVTILNEYIAQVRSSRGTQLATDLKQLIGSKSIREDLAKMPAFKSSFDEKAKRPMSYVDSGLLATQLAMLVGAKLPRAVDDPGFVGDTETDDGFKMQLLALWELSGRHGDVFVLHLGTWIEKSLTAMGEEYKQRTQSVSFVIGLLLAAALNINSIRIVDHLWQDKQSRTALASIGVESADAITQERLQLCTAIRAKGLQSSDTSAAPGSADCAAVNRLVALVSQQTPSGLRLPIGWSKAPTIEELLSVQPVISLLGWTLTALAISLGASFWFDSLKRLVNVRSGMRKPEG